MSTQYYAGCDSSGRLTLTPEAAANMKGFYQENRFEMAPAFSAWLDAAIAAPHRAIALDAMPPDFDDDPDDELNEIYSRLHGSNFLGAPPAELAEDLDPGTELGDELARAYDSDLNELEYIEQVYALFHKKRWPVIERSNQ